MDEQKDCRQEDDGEESALTTVALSALVKLHRVERKPPTEEQILSLRGCQPKEPAVRGRRAPVRPARWL